MRFINYTLTHTIFCDPIQPRNLSVFIDTDGYWVYNATGHLITAEPPIPPTPFVLLTTPPLTTTTAAQCIGAAPTTNAVCEAGVWQIPESVEIAGTIQVGGPVQVNGDIILTYTAVVVVTIVRT